MLLGCTQTHSCCTSGILLSFCLHFQVWKAAFELDLVKRRAVRNNDHVIPAPDLEAVLSDPFVREVVGATSATLSGLARTM